MKTNITNHGFTLIEIVVILPIVSFLMTVLVVLAQSTYFRILANNAETNLSLEGQVLLAQFEDELLFATDFGETKSSDLTDSYAPTGGWNANSNPETLIIYETSLTAPRRDPNRDFVYKRTYNCNSSNAAYNPIAIDNVIYFSKKNPDNPYYSLYRRVLTPHYNTCNTNYRGQTCPTANVGSGVCVKADTLLSDHLVNFEVDYYDEDNQLVNTSGSGSPLDGEKIKVTITLGNILYGESIESTSSFTMKKIN